MKAVSRMTGLTADTLRAWESRHQAVSPKRSANGRRVYRRNEIERLKLLATMVKSGHSISSIARLSDSELIAKTGRERSENGHVFEREIGVLLDHLAAFEFEEFKDQAALILFEVSQRSFVLNLLPQIMIQIGLQYAHGKISVNQEHAASEIFLKLMKRIYQDLLTERERRKEIVLLAATEGESHEFALLSAAAPRQHKGAFPVLAKY